MSVTLRIEFVDGGGTVVQAVDETKVQDGVLHVYRISSIMHIREHLGSWPLVNIKS
jgi:hypothetical protein